MAPAQFRKVIRLVHLVIAAAAALALYVPLVDAATARVALGVAFPLLGLSGVALWRQAKLRKLLNRGGRV